MGNVLAFLIIIPKQLISIYNHYNEHINHLGLHHGSPQLSFMQTSSATFYLSPKEYIPLVRLDGGVGAALSASYI